MTIQRYTCSARAPYWEDDNGDLVHFADHLAIVEKLTAERDALAERVRGLEMALRWFLEDERFQVAVGGNPNVVERMLADARTMIGAAS